ncbi:MAG: hypothetical protein AB1449_11330 [Chloroflexota bacterium]
MSDRLDDLLAELPCERCPADLVSRIQARLARARRTAFWLRSGARLGAALAAAAGMWRLSPWVGAWSGRIPAPEVQAIGQWMGLAVISPVDGARALLAGLLDWWPGLTAQIEAGTSVALALLSLAALYLAAEMMAGRGMQTGARV